MKLSQTSAFYIKVFAQCAANFIKVYIIWFSVCDGLNFRVF